MRAYSGSLVLRNGRIVAILLRVAHAISAGTCTILWTLRAVHPHVSLAGSAAVLQEDGSFPLQRATSYGVL